MTESDQTRTGDSSVTDQGSSREAQQQQQNPVLDGLFEGFGFADLTEIQRKASL